MSGYTEDDFYDETGGGDYTEAEYIEYVLGGLDPKHVKEHKITSVVILKKLKDMKNDADRVIKHFKALKAKPSVAPKQQPKPIAKPPPQVVKAQAPPQAQKTSISAADVPNVSSLSINSSSNTSSSSSSTHIYLSDDDVDAKALGTASSSEPVLTMVVAGHVDAGKSTLVGNLLYKMGGVQQRTMHKFEKDSAAIGKASFRLAW
jgi:hypothetical protein